MLEWANRVKIAAGAARGIAYLHEDCNYQSLSFYSLVLTPDMHINAYLSVRIPFGKLRFWN